MHQTTFYDYISLFCLMISGGLFVTALYWVMHGEYLYGAAFCGLGLLLWHFSTRFAKFAIAASGRQK